jgi:hypothetical protein
MIRLNFGFENFKGLAQRNPTASGSIIYQLVSVNPH